jgi:hypothetical protein|tara:strand:- start:1300 stop:1401 length:102 start_codon:yes stop_codon:yes gene_type:complete
MSLQDDTLEINRLMVGSNAVTNVKKYYEDSLWQ